jgi:F-type H+-transporting ATPase subunit b
VLSLDLWTLIAQIITFIIGMVLIYFIFVKYFVGLIDKRAAEVKATVENAEKTRLTAESLRAEYQKNLEEIEKRIQQAVKEATKEGLEVKNDIILKARQEAKDILEKTYEKISLEKEKMLKELKDEVVDMSVLLAEKIIKENITKKVDGKLVDEVLAEIEKEHN